jgi:hypothetical protein
LYLLLTVYTTYGLFVVSKLPPPPLARGSTLVPIKSKKRSLIFRCTQYRHFAVLNTGISLYSIQAFRCTQYRYFAVLNTGISLYSIQAFRCTQYRYFAVLNTGISLYSIQVFRCTQYKYFAVGNAGYNEVSGPSAGSGSSSSGSSSSEVGAVPPGARL